MLPLPCQIVLTVAPRPVSPAGDFMRGVTCCLLRPAAAERLLARREQGLTPHVHRLQAAARGARVRRVQFYVRVNRTVFNHRQ